MAGFLEFVSSIVWGAPTIGLISAFGLYFTLKSGFFQITGLCDILRDIKAKFARGKEGISPLSAFATALGGTVGIGSISGVGIALAEGGPGSVFWMWVIGFLGCMLKYAEINVAVRHRAREDGIFSGSAMHALKKSGKKIASFLFACSCLFTSFFTGCLTQSSAVAAELSRNGLPKAFCGVVIALLVFISIYKGKKTIAAISGVLIPAASAVYLTLTFFIIGANFARLPHAFFSIFKSAFGLRQAGAGAAGWAFSKCVRVGVTRGIFSSEAGMGSSPMAHSSSEDATPHSQGGWGVLEIIVDTFVFSTLTALALLSAGFTDMGDMYMFSFGSAGNTLLPVLLAVFGFAAVISWCFYGETAIKFLFAKLHPVVLPIYKALVACFAFLGAMIAVGSAWDLADIANSLMMFPNLYLLFIKRKEICLCFGRKKR